MELPRRTDLGRNFGGGRWGQRRNRRSHDFGVTLDRHRLEIAVDHEAVEGRSVSDDDGIGLVDRALDDPAVVLTLDVREEPPAGVAVLDLLGRRVNGDGGVVLDSVREFCRKRGIKFEPGPWSYPGGLV